MKNCLIIYLVIFLLGCKKDSVTTNYVIDIDGNKYQTITIGNQTWMAENLRTTHYQNGDAIAFAVNGDSWCSNTKSKIGAYANYFNNSDSIIFYGRLYNGFAVVDNRNLAPEGWHIPTNDELLELKAFVGGEYGADKLKENISSWFLNSDTVIKNGLNIRPSGAISIEGHPYGIDAAAHIWSSTEFDNQYGRWLWIWSFNFSSYINHNYDCFYEGLSVRCIKNK